MLIKVNRLHGSITKHSQRYTMLLITSQGPKELSSENYIDLTPTSLVGGTLVELMVSYTETPAL